ncbi:MAG: asparagine synthase (glutamine-hydrolyzing) [Candidatus Acidiferrales bacterium]
MCGIYAQISDSPASPECIRTIRHRGPDDEGMKHFLVPGTPLCVTLGHRRLSIIDLSPAGHQPMSNIDGTLWVTFNGEIYNFQELRAELIAAGYRFQSRTDTEVLLYGYEQWGDDLVKHLRGMFAFAIWDTRRRRLFMARDRVGKKPLFFYLDQHRFFAGSEIKSILATGEIRPELSPAALHDYLTYLYFPAPRTAFKSIEKLPPATCLSVEVREDGTLCARQWAYWDLLEAAGDPPQMSDQDAVERIRELLDEAVEIRLISDVPLGIFLSGGVDSSTITALAARHSTESVKTFSIGFQDSPLYTELPHANRVAELFRTDHHVLHARADCASHLTRVVHHFDEPFGNPTAILQYILTKVMREHVTVALSGDGGDELFGGYVRYAGARLATYYQRLPGILTKGVIPRVAGLIRDDTTGRHGFRRVREFAQTGWQPLEDMYLSWVGYFSESEKRDLYTPEFEGLVNGYDSSDFLRSMFRRGSRLDPMNRIGYVDLASFLSFNCLEYSDRMSMANSLEVRCPLTDQRLTEFAFQMPYSMKMRRFVSKWILKESMRGALPADILRKKKMGFNPPLPQWINSELKSLIAQLLDPEVTRRRGIFRPEAVAKLQADHNENRRDNSLKLWALLMLEVWQRMYLDGESESSVRDGVLAAGMNAETSYACNQ